MLTRKEGNLLKWMTGIRLINWHYFINETIRLRGSTLLTGDNGSGKSTIFDAVQFALIADQRKIQFNHSAHAETRRDLKGYLRCRTGRDDAEGGESQGYLRGGDFTSYVALEFHDTARGEHFLVGAAIDTFSGEPDTPQFFRALGPLDDALFMQGDRPHSVVEFRTLLRQRKGADLFTSLAAYRTALRAQLGHLDERFFGLILKGLAFQPITDVRKFVYDNVLDEQPVKIEAMLENFRQYRHYDTLVAKTKEKVARLQEIVAKQANRSDLERTAAIQQHVILRAAREQVQEELASVEARALQAQRRQAAAAADDARLRREIGDREQELQALRDARARDDAYQALQAIGQKLAELGRDAADLEREATLLTQQGRQEAEALAAILELAERQPTALSLADTAPLAELESSRKLWEPVARGELPPALISLQPLAAALTALGDQVVKGQGVLGDEQRFLRGEERELDEALADLRKHRIRYPKAVEALLGEISSRLPDLTARVLCELIDVPNEHWQNAVEGYLNTQRFDLFVHPSAFDAALAVYEQSKVERGIESVGLVNSEALLHSQPAAVPGSLADEVVTEDAAARAYINRLLGRVMKCETEQELKRYPVSITSTCMTYRNHTARQIEFHVYQVPYIGARAIARQIEQKQQRLTAVRQRLAEIAAYLQIGTQFLGLVRGRETARLEERWGRVTRLPELREAIRQKEAERSQIDVGALNALQRQIESKEQGLAALRGQLETATREDEKAKGELRQFEQEHHKAEADWQQRHDELERYAVAWPDLAEVGAARYMEALRSRSNQAIMQNFTLNRQGVLTQAENLGSELRDLRADYNKRYEFGGDAKAPDSAAYEQELRKLVASELPQYEEKIEHARKAAEEEFKEHFVFKVQENIRLARQEFENLNRVLKDIPFGQDRYQFVCAPDRLHRSFYDMIMDEYAMEGLTLFSLHFREKYGATLDELFSLILDVPEEKQADNIKRYTDYRTYLEFDMKILHAGGETSSFSKVAREKSGGETQTPFYVAIVASFLQLYRPRQNQHTVRLLMFDEAFNRMDPDRAEQTLQFIRRLGLQLLAAAPTDKCEIITPHVETTLLAIRDDHRAWLEDYHQVLAGAFAAESAAITEAAATGEDSR